MSQSYGFQTLDSHHSAIKQLSFSSQVAIKSLSDFIYKLLIEGKHEVYGFSHRNQRW